MDTITHGIVGALTGKALFAGRDAPAMVASMARSHKRKVRPIARTAIVACTLGSIFPDIDIFAGTLARNPLAIMEWHRNITHSLVMLPLWAALLAALSIPLARWLRWERPSFPKMFAICAAGLATHVFLDVVTDFGTMVWSPLGYSRVAWDWVFILDLTLTSVALVPQLAAWCYRDPLKFRWRATAVWAALTAGAFGAYVLAATAGYGFPIAIVGIVSAIFAVILFAPYLRGAGFDWTRARWCRTGLTLVCAYLALASTMHGKALAEVDHFAAEHHLPGDNLAALPLPPTVTNWAGVVATTEGVWRVTFQEPGGQIERTQFYADPPPDRYVTEAKKLHDVQVYLWFARFPVWQELQENGQTILDISDVRFFREDDSAARVESGQPLRLPGIRPNPAGFTFEVVFSRDGKVVSSGFKKPE